MDELNKLRNQVFSLGQLTADLYGQVNNMTAHATAVQAENHQLKAENEQLKAEKAKPEK